MIAHRVFFLISIVLTLFLGCSDPPEQQGPGDPPEEEVPGDSTEQEVPNDSTEQEGPPEEQVCNVTLNFDQPMRQNTEPDGIAHNTITGYIEGQTNPSTIILTELGGNNKLEAGPIIGDGAFRNDRYFISYINGRIFVRTRMGGAHSIRVIDSLGCTVETEFQLPYFLSLTFTETKQPTCLGVDDGIVSVKIEHGEGPFTLGLYQLRLRYPHSDTYYYATEVITTDERDYRFDNVAAGTYRVQVSDGKSEYAIIDLLSFSDPGIEATVETNSSYNDCKTGEAVVRVVTAKAEPYTFELKRCPQYNQVDKVCMNDCCTAAQPIASSTDGHFKQLAAGLYGIEITDANGCKSYDIPFTIEQSSDNSSLSIDVVSEGNSQCLVPNGSLVAIASDGIAPYSYELRKGATVITPWTDQGNFNSLKDGQYTVYVQDGNGCVKSKSHEVPRLNTNVRYANTIRPIFELKCNNSGCHDGTIGATLNFTDRAIIKSKGNEIIHTISNNLMPPPTYPYSVPLTSEEIANIICWIKDGSLDN